jgi:DNA primase
VISLHQGGVENVVASSGTSLTEDQLRLIGQLTKNLTILYDGDSAGIKAALRGLDMALSQSFNVQLVLLPDGEDPDSYVQKSGAAVFHEYIKKHKQDVISFRLQVGLIDAGTDPVKRSKLVNEIAESISRINKAEDFSLQGHYIREASQKLNVEETGLINLVNKYIRERVENDQKHSRKAEGANIPPDAMPLPEVLQSPEEVQMRPVRTDELQEWQLIRVLIEYGHMPYEGYESVAKLLEDRVEADLIQTPLARKLFLEYLAHYSHFGATPEVHYFINHPDSETRGKMANLLHENVGISAGWKAKLNIEPLLPGMVYMRDVNSSLEYFELKKALKMLEELTQKISTETDTDRMMVLLESHLHLKKVIREITQTHKPTVYNSNKVKF